MGHRAVHRPVECDRLDDTGGVWIITAVILGLLMYVGVVVMLVAGFTVVAPLAVLPPVLVGLIGGNSLLGGGRRHGRPVPDPVPLGPLPRSSDGPDGPIAPGSPVAGEPTGPQ